MKIFKMPSDIRASNRNPETYGEVRLSLDLKNSSKRQQDSKIVKEPVLPTQLKHSLKHQEKLKLKNSQRFGDLPLELRQQTNDGILHQQRTLGNCQQQLMLKTKKDDELVKYMSNLPGYLQRKEREESIQDKALKVGILDWSRIEKWKCDQMFIAARDGHNASLSTGNLPTKMPTGKSTFSSTFHKKTHTIQSKQHSSLCSSHNSSHDDHMSRGAKTSIQNAKRFQDFAAVSQRSVEGQKGVSRTYNSFDRNNSDVSLERGKRKDLGRKISSKVGNRSSDSGTNAALIKPKENVTACNGEAEKKSEDKQESCITRKALDQNFASSMETSSSKQRNPDVSLSLKEKKNVGNAEIKKGMVEFQDSTIDLFPHHQPGKNKNVVLILPKKFSQKNSLEEPGMSLHKNLTEAYRNNASDACSHEEVYSSDPNSEFPRPCPLPSSAETNTELCNIRHTATNTLGAELSSDASACLCKAPIMLSASANAEMSSIKSGNVVETSKNLDQESTMWAATKGRHPSPNRRFSFSLSRMTRSFSFKDSSAVPWLSTSYVSMKSGPMTSRASSCLDNSNREKVSGHNRARSSPLRRILDPLLKPRGLSQLPSAETDYPLKGNLNSFSFKTINAIESLHNGKDETSRIQALLQLTIRNGLPLFRFVVENNSSILAAATNYLTSSGKNDSGCNYTFYTIDEIKKKSGSWINQGTKEKSCGYVYNVVGQMKVNSSSFFDLAGPNSISQYTVKESVLFGVELRQADQGSPKFMPNRELAAVVVKMPGASLSIETMQTSKDEDSKEKSLSSCMPENECFCNMEENEHFNSTTVILPGGVHSLPNKGVPSPLIHRWKFGGSCDCGGWDVGCKLHILSNGYQYHKIPKMSKAWPASDQFELFVQGGAQEEKPIFSLAPMEKGMYSIEFISSISLLQAFFICVAVISCQRSSDLAEVSNLLKEKVSEEHWNANDGTKKIHTVFQGASKKYTPNPPLSPVGRV